MANQVGKVSLYAVRGKSGKWWNPNNNYHPWRDRLIDAKWYQKIGYAKNAIAYDRTAPEMVGAEVVKIGEMEIRLDEKEK